jgi:hypothetical protein
MSSNIILADSSYPLLNIFWTTLVLTDAEFSAQKAKLLA